MFESAASGSLMGKCRCGPYVVALRIGNAVADGELRVLLLIGIAVADVQEGRCGFCRGGAALSGTLRMDLRNLQQQNRCALSRIMRALGGRVIMCYPSATLLPRLFCDPQSIREMKSC